MRILLISLIASGCADKREFNGEAPRASTCEILSAREVVRWSDGIYRDSEVSRCRFGTETCFVYKYQNKMDLNCEK